MKTILLLSTLALSSLHATTVNFNELVDPFECFGIPGGLTSGGYSFTAVSTTQTFAVCTGTPALNGFNYSSNGTNALGLGGFNDRLYDFVRTDGAAFSFHGIDFAQFFKLGYFAYSYNATSFELRGFLGGTQVASATFPVTIVSDGPGGMPDFTTVTVSGFSNVDRLGLVTFNTEQPFGYILIDNLVMGEPNASPVPEPPSLALGGLALVALSVRSRLLRRRS